MVLSAWLILSLTAPGALTPPTALVELFSSEGCSSCPPADNLLRELSDAQPGLVALEFHVDYWNSLGWVDPFSSGAYSERQSQYAERLGQAEVFTPQAIVDGTRSLVGSDRVALVKALAQGRAPLPLEVSLADGKLRVRGTALPQGKLWLAIAETGLASAVLHGENRGRTLLHAAVVRRFEPLGVTEAGDLERNEPLTFDSAWRRQNLEVVAALQDSRTGAILALGRTSPATSITPADRARR